MRVVVAGDDELVVMGVKNALTRDDVTIQVVVPADGDVRDLLVLPAPDLYVICLELITDETAGLLGRLRLAGGSGVVPVLVLVPNGSERAVALIRGGMCVVVRNQVHSAQLAAMAMVMIAGYLPIPQDGVDEVLAHQSASEESTAAGQTAVHKLTRREREVFELIRLGMTNPQIAETLSIARSTVKSHIESILDKLGLRSRVEIMLGMPPSPIP
jgi:two-component system, NarL family, nitrate/nitrite response regulator NarL